MYLKLKVRCIQTDSQQSHSNCSSDNISQKRLFNISIQKDARCTGGLTSVWATEMCEWWDALAGKRRKTAFAASCHTLLLYCEMIPTDSQWQGMRTHSSTCLHTCKIHATSSFFLFLLPCVTVVVLLCVCMCRLPDFTFLSVTLFIFCSLHPVFPFHLWCKSIKKSCFLCIFFSLCSILSVCLPQWHLSLAWASKT